MDAYTLQHLPAEVKSKALNYKKIMCCIVLDSNHNQCFVLNMDQTLVYFLMNAKRTLELIGKKMVHKNDCSGWYAGSVNACP
jgi:hypothetical protein